MNRSAAAWLLTVLALSPLWLGGTGCRDKTEADTGSGYNTGPSITHSTLGPQVEGSVNITAQASDSDGVAEVAVYHRAIGVSFWELTLLEQDGDDWSTDLDVTSPGFQYYLRATDRFGAEGFLPEDADAGPWEVTVQPQAKELPFTEDFELDPGETSLYSLGWTTVSEGFAVYSWQLSTSRASSGAQSAFHGRGAVDADTMKDWLISPPINFEGLEQIQVTWRESGASTAAMGTHGLYASTRSADPSVPDAFVAIEASLPAPVEDEFARSAVIDLSDYAGERLVWLSWLYEGEYGDDWYIDDVRIEALSADLSALYNGQSPEPVFPGETLTVDWTITNGSAASAAGYEATLALPDGGGTVTTPTQAVPDLEGYASAPMSWDIELDPDVQSDRYRSMELTITNGSNTWTFDEQFLIGYLSTATLDITLGEPAITQITLGVGDPAAPDTEFSIYSDFLDAGGAAVVSDLTPYADLLPPAAGPERWFARVQTDRDGLVNAFTMSVSGVDYGGAESGGALTANQSQIFYVPRPPEPTVTRTEPASVAPGDVDVPIEVQLENAGADTQGPLTGTLTSTEPDVTLTGGTALTLDPDVFTSGEIAVLTGPTMTVDASHTNSQPVRLQLDMTDGVDSWSVPIDVQVPWPVLEVVGVTIDDSGGDGILDNGESASIELEVANVGGLPTLGRMDVVASLDAGSTASATFDDAEDRLSSLDPGDTADLDLELSAVSGSTGEELLIALSADDGTRIYSSTASIKLGEPPWTTLSPTNDTIGDSADPTGTTFDFINGRYRVFDGNIEVVLESAVEYDPATLYIEAWGSSSGSSYLYYRFVVNAGITDFQGYVSGTGWQPIGTVTVDYLSSTEVMMSWPIADMETITSGLAIGFGTTWCGPPEYYCDHFPDGWGYGYDSGNFFPSYWFDLSW